MKVLLTCSECDFREFGSSEKELMNKIIVWNHLKHEHPRMADRIMRMYKTAPNSIFDVQPA
jgi:predicted small metal-binding protein